MTNERSLKYGRRETDQPLKSTSCTSCMWIAVVGLMLVLGLIVASTAHADTHEARLCWHNPTQNTDNSPLTNLQGAHIWRWQGTAKPAAIAAVPVGAVDPTCYVDDSPMTPGTYFYAVSAFTGFAESVLSAPATHIIRRDAPSGGVVIPAPKGGIVLPNTKGN